jgi:hypothetical protein
MKHNRYLLIAIVVIAICLVTVAVSTAIPDNGGKYEVSATVDVPGYKTDATRAIDAYERLMERYMDLSENFLSKTGFDSQVISARLDSIDSRLIDISTRLARIEKALGIDPNTGAVIKRK